VKLVKKKNEIKIVKETDANYTFVDTTPFDLNHESEPNTSSKMVSNSEKDLLKARQIDSRKSKIRNKNRMVGGQNRQSHSSVYE
jgi:uncharacterized protein YmfQ (DUF2313 family)